MFTPVFIVCVSIKNYVLSDVCCQSLIHFVCHLQNQTLMHINFCVIMGKPVVQSIRTSKSLLYPKAWRCHL